MNKLLLLLCLIAIATSILCPTQRCALCDLIDNHCLRCHANFIQTYPSINTIQGARNQVNCDCPPGTVSTTQSGSCVACSQVFGTQCLSCGVISRSPYQIGCTICSGKFVVDSSNQCFCNTSEFKLSSDNKRCGQSCSDIIFGCNSADCNLNGTDYICTKCKTTHTLNINTGFCDCKQPNNTFNSAGSCVSCANTNGIPRCTDCQNQTCTNCLQGSTYNLITGKCDCTITGCKTCSNSENSCTTCLDGYRINSNDSQCIQCPTDNCKKCNTNRCTQCKDGFYLNSTYFCLPCSIECTLCHGSPTNCSACTAIAYSDMQNFACKLCTSNCIQCTNGSQCQTCQQGTFLNNSECIKCQITCKTCQSSSVCTSCIDNHYLILNSCQPCPKGKFQFSPGVCNDCMENCADCDNAESCYECDQNYWLSINNTCQNCQEKNQFCKSCDANGDCLGCDDSNATDVYIFENGTCTPCSVFRQNCSTCNPDGSCQICENGFVLQGADCIECTLPQNCISCSSSSGNCSGCLSGYYLNPINFECQRCSQIQRCSRCNNSGCVLCNDGYYPYQSYSCKSCGQVLPNCTICINSSECVKCQSGFIVSSGRCMRPTSCPLNCSTCSPTTFICSECTPGFYLINNQCTACGIINCESCRNSTTCTSCIPGYVPNGNHCILNATCSTGCISCVNSVCYNCNRTKNFILQQYSCVCPVGSSLVGDECQCPINEQFNSEFKCVCSKGYIMNNAQTGCTECSLDAYYSNATGQCIPCSPTCLTCSNDSCCSSCSTSSNRYLQGCTCKCIPYRSCV